MFKWSNKITFVNKIKEIISFEKFSWCFERSIEKEIKIKDFIITSIIYLLKFT